MVEVDIGNDFFFFGTNDKMWITFEDSIFELKGNILTGFNISISDPITEYKLFDSTYNEIYNPSIEFSFDGVTTTINDIPKKDVDLSDFFSMEEMKKLSNVIQRKFDKINEREDKDV